MRTFELLTTCLLPAAGAVTLLLGAATAAPLSWHAVDGWLKLPTGADNLGNAHGDLGIASNGEIYVSVTGGPHGGLQVYGPDGKYRRNVPGAPADLHGFVIRREAGGEFLYGALLSRGEVIKMSLDGQVALRISGSAIPKEKWGEDPKTKTPQLKLTACAVAPNGDIYVTDGYGTDFLHRFNAKGDYLGTSGGKVSPFSFSTLHKLAIDTRFDPVRLIATDRAHHRVVHLSLEGELLGEVATGLRLPSAVAVHGDLLAIGELQGRVTVLDKHNRVVAQVGTNDAADETGTNRTPPEKWRPGVLNAAHGVAFDPAGNLLVTEWSVFGRVQRFDLTR